MASERKFGTAMRQRSCRGRGGGISEITRSLSLSSLPRSNFFADEPHGRGTVVIEPTVLGFPPVSDVGVDADSLLESVVRLHVIVLRVPRRDAAVLRRVEMKGRRSVGPDERVFAVAAGSEPERLGPIVGGGEEEERTGEIRPVFHRRERGQVGIEETTVFLSLVKRFVQFHHDVLRVRSGDVDFDFWFARRVLLTN